eukprot:EG_transcript_32504
MKFSWRLPESESGKFNHSVTVNSQRVLISFQRELFKANGLAPFTAAASTDPPEETNKQIVSGQPELNENRVEHSFGAQHPSKEGSERLCWYNGNASQKGDRTDTPPRASCTPKAGHNGKAWCEGSPP